MEFGPVPLALAQGAILAHSVPLPNGRLRKGVVLGPDDLARLAAAGLAEVTVARLGPQDMHEDAAALAIARRWCRMRRRRGLRCGPWARGG